jgi:hypothetical protein
LKSENIPDPPLLTEKLVPPIPIVDKAPPPDDPGLATTVVLLPPAPNPEAAAEADICTDELTVPLGKNALTCADDETVLLGMTFVNPEPSPDIVVAVRLPIIFVDPVTFNEPVIFALPAIVFNEPLCTEIIAPPPIPLPCDVQ